jgi:DNA-binding NarL/FixJ family response regulator
MSYPANPHNPQNIREALMCGLTNKQIAHKLHIAETTVATHLRSAMQDYGVTNRTALALRIAGVTHEQTQQQG